MLDLSCFKHVRRLHVRIRLIFIRFINRKFNQIRMKLAHLTGIQLKALM